MAERACGSCTLCCKALALDQEIKKLGGVWCQHCQIGKGCKIYDTRPTDCRQYRCMWLADEWGLFAEDERPDKLGLVMDLHDDPLSVRIFENSPGASQQRVVRRIAERAIMELKIAVVIFQVDHRDHKLGIAYPWQDERGRDTATARLNAENRRLAFIARERLNQLAAGGVR